MNNEEIWREKKSSVKGKRKESKVNKKKRKSFFLPCL